MNLQKAVNAALGSCRAELVIKNASVLNVFTESFEIADIAISDGFIVGIGSYDGQTEIDATGKYAVPSFIDGHVHIESSIVSPREYCKAVLPHGTAAVVADPHEITNVCGKDGFMYMLEEGKNLPLNIYLMVPSCVPATPFDESGASVTSKETEELLSLPRVLGLAEMMNYPGVLSCDPEVHKKLSLARDNKQNIDGHAPMLSGKELNAYLTAGIRSDHECTTAEEAIEKISRGQWIMIREGTASKNLLALLPLFKKPFCDRCLLVTDDKHSGELKAEGHIDHIIRKAIANGADAIVAYKMASYNASSYFGLSRNGAIAPGYFADLVLLDDLTDVKINSVYKHGLRVDLNTDYIVNSIPGNNAYLDKVKNTVNLTDITPDSFALKKVSEKVIGLVAGQILTTDEGYASAVDTAKDICKLAVVERHHATGNIGIAFIKGYGLKKGAVATSISHDSHNIIAVGTNDLDMAVAVSHLKSTDGGMAVVLDGKVICDLPLPIAGLMCELDAITAEERLNDVKNAAHSLGVFNFIDPFMTLSFASLTVIPTLRLTTKGVVDVCKFELID